METPSCNNVERQKKDTGWSPNICHVALLNGFKVLCCVLVPPGTDTPRSTAGITPDLWICPVLRGFCKTHQQQNQQTLKWSL